MIDDAMIVAATRVVDANRAAGRTIALAESCTGGLVAGALTAVPGSSSVLLASVVAYANEAKTALIGVPADIIETFGAVSTGTAWAMARGMLARSGADVVVAVTGVAGPDGGTARNPVGTVVFARGLRGQSDADYWVQRTFCPVADRAVIRRQAVLFALDRLLPDDALPASDDDLMLGAP